MWTCLHNNVLVLDRDCGALHWWSLAIRSSVESASEPRGIKLLIFLILEGGIIMDFRRITSILSCSNLEESFTNRILVMLMDLWKIDLFLHKFYLNLYMYEILTLTIICLGGWTVLYTTVFTAPKYGFKVWICRWGQSRVFLPSSILDLLINTDIVIIIIPESEFRIHTYSCIYKSTSASYL